MFLGSMKILLVFNILNVVMQAGVPIKQQKIQYMFTL